MKIVIKTLDGASFRNNERTDVGLGKRVILEVQPTDTVDDVRKLIETMEGTSPGENQIFLH